MCDDVCSSNYGWGGRGGVNGQKIQVYSIFLQLVITRLQLVSNNS